MAFWTGRKVIVTGSEGLIGKPLMKMLWESGAERLTFDLATNKADDILSFDRFLSGVRAFQPSVIIHLAAMSHVGECRKVPYKTFRVLAQGTVNVLEAARLYGKADAVLTASSNHIYGEQSFFRPSREGANLRALDAYSVSKICADYMTRSYGKVYKVPTVAIRNTNCYGPDDPHGDHIVPTIVTALLKKEQIKLRGDGRTRKGYLYVDDVARAYIVAAQAIVEGRIPRGEAYNVTDKEVTVLDLVETAGRVLGIKPKVELGQGDGIQHDEDLDDALFRKVTGWKPQFTLEQGLRKTIAGFASRLGVDFQLTPLIRPSLVKQVLSWRF